MLHGCAGIALDGLARVRASIVLLVACGQNVAPPSDCDRPGSRVSAGNVTAEALAGGIVRVRYGAGEASSWAIALPPAPDPDARVGDKTLCTAAMTVRIEGGLVTATLADGTVVVDDARPYADGTLVRTAQRDRVYGLGERTGGLDKRGRAWTFWNTDAYDPDIGGWKPDQDPLYQSIPLEVHFATSAFGIFTDVTRRMVIELGGAEDRITTVGPIDQYLIAGPRIADVVDRYTQLTGRPAAPPSWALGFHQSRWGYSQADLEAIAARFRELDIPATALWLDIQHMRGFRSFTFDPQTFPDPRGLIERLASRGFRVVAIEDPGIKIDPGWDVYDSGLPHFLQRDGAAYQGVAWPGPSAFADFSSPAARQWWGDLVARTLDLGVAGIWLDVNEPTTFPEGGGGNTIPDDIAAVGDGRATTMAELHNAYALFQARATYEAIAARGEQPFVLSRAGYAGIQRYAATWTGDTPSTWWGLRQTLPMMLGLGMSGVPIVGSDIGGYSGGASPELYARWLALGSISPFARAHVTAGVPGQEPWQFGAEVTDAAREWLKQRERLLPYLIALADEAARTGAPLLRPLVWEFQDDTSVADIGDEAMLGPWLLVAPVLDEGATTRQIYLPAGRWFELASDAYVDGPTTIDVPLRIASLPIYVRAGAIIPTAEDVLEIYPGDERSRFAGVEVEPLADGIRISLPRAYRVRVHRVDRAVTAYPYDANARVIEVLQGAGTFELHYDRTLDEPRPPVTVTFEVHVPDGTPLDPPIHVASSLTAWTHVPLAWVAPGVARGTFVATRGEWIDYKLTRGSWQTVEKLADCGEAPNRTRIASATTRIDSVAKWRDSCGNY